MKRSMSLLIAALLAAPAAMAASDIVKCVDAAGHVTFTDQPCPAGATATRLAQDGAAAYGGSGTGGDTGASGPDGPSATATAAAPAPALQRYVLPPADMRHAAWKQRAAERPASLARDIATLKEARRMQLLQDGPRQHLAGIAN
ncbi:DUF4124 domain-containing protein [uncultured Massilia sp.]|uniref:DUF4124 domain-containing protein n=1 Tax=uncultured Massilia sp. TaxID=169973 RepID=UPI0025F13AE9|nr:DUF4124 domain-containing protein [uncultured Massilia sp.]